MGCLHPLRLTDGLDKVWSEAVADEEETLGKPGDGEGEG
jgi:hypothetical protein